MIQEPHRQRALVRDALESVRHAIPRDLARDVEDYNRRVGDPELAADVLVDGIVEGRVLLSVDEFDAVRLAMEACGRDRDRRLTWIEEHGLKPLPAATDDWDD
jgi:hypothetical protein